MLRLASLLVFFSLCPTLQVSAQTFDARRATTVSVVEDMTCAQARAYVTEHKRYYKMTEKDGALPIYPVQSVTKDPTCGRKEVVVYELVHTRDNARCHVGYGCKPN